MVLLNASGSSCPRINHFSKDPWFLLLESDIRNQDLEYFLDVLIGCICWMCSLLLEYYVSLDRARIDIDMDIDIVIDRYIGLLEKS